MARCNSGNSDYFYAEAINQKNVSMNANQALSAVTAIIQDVEEFQIAHVEIEQEIEYED